MHSATVAIASVLVVLWGGNGMYHACSAENSNGKPTKSTMVNLFQTSVYFQFELCLSVMLSLCKQGREISVCYANMGVAYSV